jgi:hypothetical protein
VEIVDDDLVRQNGAEHLLKVQLIDSDNLVVTLSGSHLSEVGKNPAKQPVATKNSGSGESLEFLGSPPVGDGRGCDKGTLRSVQSALNNIKCRGLKDALWNEGRGRQEGQSKTREPARNPCKTECAQPTKEEQAKSHLIPMFKRISLVLLDAFAWFTDRSESRPIVRIQLPPPTN